MLHNTFNLKDLTLNKYEWSLSGNCGLYPNRYGVLPWSTLQLRAGRKGSMTCQYYYRPTIPARNADQRMDTTTPTHLNKGTKKPETNKESVTTRHQESVSE